MSPAHGCEEPILRPETVSDIRGVHQLNRRAFSESELGYGGEAELVDRIRSSEKATLSLVAEQDGRVVGHILFTSVEIDGSELEIEGASLGPMAVVPELQGQGIGTRLVNEGLQRLKERGVPFVAVLGHPEYYPRFGFQPSAQFGVRCEFEGVPAEAFMLVALDPKVPIPDGVARYLPEFSDAT